MKKITAIFLAIMLLLTLFACTPSNQQENNNETPAPTSSETEDLTEGGKYMDYEGAGGESKYKLPSYNVSGETMRLLISAESTLRADKFYAIRDVYGCNYEAIVTTPNEESTKFLSMFMANESPNVWQSGFHPSLAYKGYIAAWDDYVDFSIGIWEDVKSTLDAFKWKGHNYALGAGTASPIGIIWYNEALFEEMGVKTPKEYYDEGNWTWDTYKECIKAMTIDGDGDGMPEVYGVYMPNTTALSGTTGIDYVTMHDDGSVTSNILDQRVADAINFYTEINNSGYAYMGSDAPQQFAAGKIAMVYGGYWYKMYFPELIKNGDAKVISLPKYGDTSYQLTSYGNWSLPTNLSEKQIEVACAYVNSMRYDAIRASYEADETRAELEALSISEQMEELDNATLELQDLFNEMTDSKNYTPVAFISDAFGVTAFSGDMYFSPLMGEPWATIAERIEPQLIENISELLEEQ